MATMRAAVLRQYGAAEVLHVEEIPRPDPKPGQVLIRVRAAGLNPIDWRTRNGSLRFVLPGTWPLVLGYDISGEVVQSAADASPLRPGDEVFCMADTRFGGGYAEYAAVGAAVVVTKPASLSHAEAAAVPLAAMTALQALRDHGRLASGGRVLINGASGGVGTFAVQVAKLLGGEVTAVTSGKNGELVRQLGADHVIDYTQTDITRQDPQYDVVLDAISKTSYWACRRILKPHGRFVILLPTPPHLLNQALTWIGAGRQSRTFMVQARAGDLRWLKERIEAGRLRPVIDTVFPLDQAAEAHRRSEAGHVRGKLILEP